MDIPSYDRWKLQSPPWMGDEDPPECPVCGMPVASCLCSEPAEQDDRAEAEAVDREALQ